MFDTLKNKVGGIPVGAFSVEACEASEDTVRLLFEAECAMHGVRGFLMLLNAADTEGLQPLRRQSEIDELRFYMHDLLCMTVEGILGAVATSREAMEAAIHKQAA